MDALGLIKDLPKKTFLINYPSPIPFSGTIERRSGNNSLDMEITKWEVKPIPNQRENNINILLASSTTGSAAAYSDLSQRFTTNISFDNEMILLEKAVNTNNIKLFNTIINAIEWENMPVDTYIKTIRMALLAGNHNIARILAKAGGDKFPKHVEMRNLSVLLGPARIVKTGLPANPNEAKDITWLKENRDKYRGLWVALSCGVLIADATSYHDLIKKLDNPRGRGLLITPVY